ncbi:complex I subunit 5 family protein [Aureimonas sp. SK2]|uniref:complex I subunit 5 family protein n=1 Tax=Aureimonas sp. SK2 TaxID=3015992 RepID=UPI0024439D5F|nr:proton-conducting transporter membrane subunit [Aureimonas sp. SK2]
MTVLRELALPELLVALPLLAALVSLVQPSRPGLVLALSQGAQVACAVALAATVWTGGPVARAVGGWEPPLGIVLHADGLATAFVLASTMLMLGVGAFAHLSSELARVRGPGPFAFWPLFHLMAAALAVLFLSRDLFNLYVGLELLTISAVGMVALGSVAAATRYLLFALMGSLAYLAGVVLFYAAAGTLDIDFLAASGGEPTVVGIGAALVTAGLLVKTALFPFHAWLPEAHGSAPAPASALLSALVVKASFLILARLWFEILPDAGPDALMQLLGLLGACAVIYGSLLALREDSLKRIVAYSTVAQLGYLFFVFPLAAVGGASEPIEAAGWSGAMIHALSHAFAKSALFLCAGIVVTARGGGTLEHMRGLARALPMTITAFGLAAVSIMGLPPSGGFMAKYLMLTSALAQGKLALALVMLVGGLLAAIYLFRPLNAAMARSDVPEIRPVPRSLELIALGLALVATLLGIFSAAPYEFLQIGRPAITGEAIP